MLLKIFLSSRYGGRIRAGRRRLAAKHQRPDAARAGGNGHFGMPATPVMPPPNIVPGSPYAEVVRLTQAGVDQGIIGTYIINSTSLFNLDSDKIIYLTNLGAPSSVIRR